MSNEEQECQPELLAEQWGARLVSARESLSISLEQAATDLNLPADYIDSIERGSLDGLPSMVFARGYIRSYAKLLGLDNGDELVCEFEDLHGEGSCRGQIRPVSKVRQQVKMNDPVMKLSSWVFVLAIIGVSVWWWQTQYGGSFDFTSAEDSVSENVAEPSSEPATVLENGQAQLALPALDDSPAGEAPVESSDAAAESEPQYLSSNEIKKLQQAIDKNEVASTVEPTETAVAVPAVDLLADISVSADFVAECWVSIKDADGKNLFNNLRGKGQSVNVTGKPPLSVLIGAADAVGAFRYNGKPFDLTPYNRKNVVRLSLPVSE